MHTEQDILDLAAQMKQWRIDAENAAIAKGFSDVSTNDLLGNIKDNMLSSYPGFKDVWTDKTVVIASNHVADASVISKVCPWTVNPVGCTSDTASGDGTAYETKITITCPSEHQLPAAPIFYRVLITGNGGTKCQWVMDPV